MPADVTKGTAPPMELNQYAWVDPNREPHWLSQLASEAVDENWGRDRTYLKYYCETNFTLAHAQGLIYEDPEGRYALWRVGHLRSADGAPIYAVFVPNTNPHRQPWFFLTFLARRNPVVRLPGSARGTWQVLRPGTPPREPDYEPLTYSSSFMVEYNWDHFLKDRADRLASQMPEIENERVLYLSLFGAMELAHRHYPQYAVPSFYNGRYQHMLPLYITTGDTRQRPDLVAVLDANEERGMYSVRTLLPPDWAYSNARAIALNTAAIRPWLG